MLAVAGMCSVPADVDVRVVLRQQLTMLSRAPERVVPPPGGVVARSPEEETDVDAAMGSAFEHVEGRAATVRHMEGGPHECDGRPHTLLCELDGLADAAKGGVAIDQRQDPIARAGRVG